MTKVVQVRTNVDWMRGIVVRRQKGPNSENIQQVEVRGFAGVGGVVSSVFICLFVCFPESIYRADKIQSDNINKLRYGIKCSHFILKNTAVFKSVGLSTQQPSR